MKTRKLFVVALALVLTLCMTATAFATAGNDTVTSISGSNTKTIEVTGTYSGSDVSGDVYSVDISWGAMEFTYTVVSGQAWDPKTHQYSPTVEPKWEATNNGNTITTANHSNKAVNVAFAFAKDETNAPNVIGSFDKESYILSTADTGESLNNPGKAPTDTSTLTISGTLEPDKTGVKIGTVTVTLSEVVTP